MTSHDAGHRNVTNDGDFERLVGGRLAQCKICQTSVWVCAYCNMPIPIGKTAILSPPFGSASSVLMTVLHKDKCYGDIQTMINDGLADETMSKDELVKFIQSQIGYHNDKDKTRTL
jgi:hypothetical protein